MHCAAGKDRAGLSVAVTLLALGVEREAVVEDYLKSNAAHRRYKVRRSSTAASAYSEVMRLLSACSTRAPSTWRRPSRPSRRRGAASTRTWRRGCGSLRGRGSGCASGCWTEPGGARRGRRYLAPTSNSVEEAARASRSPSGTAVSGSRGANPLRKPSSPLTDSEPVVSPWKACVQYRIRCLPVA
ncbi:hypothetical protein STENM36S_04198 [Streptomyces tendae]